MFTSIEEYENLKISEIPERDLVIRFKKDTPDSAEIYFNGDKLMDFNERIVCIEVPCDGIYEIKNNSNRQMTVTVSSENPDLISEIINSEFNYGISPLCRVNTD